MESALLVSAGEKGLAGLRELITSHMPLPEIVTAGDAGTARRLFPERDFDLCVVNTPLPDEFGDAMAAEFAAAGICQVLLMCALHKGGTRKLKERYEHYFNLGVGVLTGESNWVESVIEGEAPHDATHDEEEEPLKKIEKDKVSVKMSETDEKEAPVVYKRWKPEKKDQ